MEVMDARFLVGQELDSLTNILINEGGSASHAQKLSRWLYRKRLSDLRTIDNIPKILLEKVCLRYGVGYYQPIETFNAADGSRKYLFQNDNGQRFESLLMKSLRRTTLCVSSQSGCRMGCKFCMTGSIGFKGNLTAHDILNQLLSIPDSKSVNRIVIMGMGEPFDNSDEVLRAIRILTADWGCAFGKSNITLSSVGILDELEIFLKNPICNLAISLHSPFPEERKSLMPIEMANPIATVIDLIKKYPLPKPLRVSFEYVALGGINLSEQHAEAISKLLQGIQCHLNIIPWNSHENALFNTPNDDELQVFINLLNSLGVLTTIRKSMGGEIAAACGQMAGKHSGVSRL
ncbi:putative dual-specificity RNA methyltransferase RlmN [Tenuifilaceae bacterium CYCD]|nr:putative dual-specificity RNA methyltransferase RlmN [Tenuifilaceae bacterium CYCD]